MDARCESSAARVLQQRHADVIRDFANNVDTISLLGLGVKTVAQALARATQVGDDVLFDFGRGDTLRVEDITLSALRDDLVFA